MGVRWGSMDKKEYADRINLKKLRELEKAVLLTFYQYKTSGQTHFSMRAISDIMSEFGQSKPNTARLKKKMLATEFFKKDNNDPGFIRFTDIGLDILGREQRDWWEDYISIDSYSELIDETKFCGYRGYLDSLIRQINHSYANNCYDAVAVLMRRLFEITLIHAYQSHDIDAEIRAQSGSGYQALEKIVANAKSNRTLKLSRITKRFDDFRNLGNYSAHSITYIASKNDIDDVKQDYRAALEELYYKAGLIRVRA